MANVSMDLVKKLRDRTQVGMMDCKKALEETDGDFDKAIDLLRQKGSAVALKRADNETKNGRIEAYISNDFTLGALVEVACETDFSAHTEAMELFTKDVAAHVAVQNPASTDILLKQASGNNASLTIEQKLQELIAKICESIKVSRFVRFNSDKNGFINAYIHPGSTVGVMIQIKTDKEAFAHKDVLKELTKDLCMQVAVTSPLSIDTDALDPEVIKRERAIAQEQMKDSGKPAQVLEKIIDGKIQKFYKEVCLLQQLFIKNDKLSVAQVVEETGKKLGLKISVVNFVRFSIGR
jgi:elongation factor Ts